MVSESVTSSNLSSNTYDFVTPIKLYQNNFIVWRTQVLTSIKGNGLEGFITGTNKCPDQHLVQDEVATNSSSFGSRSRIDHPTFSVWIKIDQLLRSWMMSSIQENLLSLVIHCVSSQELWESLNRMFVSQTQARIMPIKMQLQTVKKGSMTMSAYFAKMKRLADTFAIAGKSVENADLVN
ncbi:hypothetical protein AB3S75_023676 [Citrus x aurantiifolia]